MKQDLFSVDCGVQLSVFLDDHPGSLAGVTGLLGSHGINVFAMTLSEGIGHGYVRLVVDRPEAARKLLEDAGELILERQVLLLELANRPGSLARAARTLAEAGVNVEYAYCAGGRQVERGLVVIKVSDLEKGLEALRDS